MLGDSLFRMPCESVALALTCTSYPQCSKTLSPPRVQLGLAPMNHSHAKLVATLTSRWPEHRVAPNLKRIAALMDLLGSPQDAFPVIQVAGTNGKGSTAIMIDTLLRSAGLRVGRFASPHLSDARERINIDGEPVDEERFSQIWEEVEPFVAMVDGQQHDGINMTFFEVITGMAYAAFADAPVDVAVVEVGLGGRWDATSVATPAVAVVTPVGLDHTHILGTNLGKVALEKAGIIKSGSTAVLGYGLQVLKACRHTLFVLPIFQAHHYFFGLLFQISQTPFQLAQTGIFWHNTHLNRGMRSKFSFVKQTTDIFQHLAYYFRSMQLHPARN